MQDLSLRPKHSAGACVSAVVTDVLRMDEWWKALEDDCNRELRVLFQFENIKMKKLLRKLQLRCSDMSPTRSAEPGRVPRSWT